MEVVAIHFMIVATRREVTQVDDDGILRPTMIILDGHGHHPHI